ncbi:hypothetical protein MMC18_001609 [Xylographa bjoerkii]|nr:hypothetical protein [Xylographa bjoerkii]
MAASKSSDSSFVKSNASILSIPPLPFVPQGIYRIVNVGSQKALTITNNPGQPSPENIPQRGESTRARVPFVSVWGIGGDQGKESVNQLWALTRSPTTEQANSSSQSTYTIHSLKSPPQPGDQPPPINPSDPSPFARSSSPDSSAATVASSNYAFAIAVRPNLASEISQIAILPSIAKAPGNSQLPTFPSQRSLPDRPLLNLVPDSGPLSFELSYHDIIATPRTKQGVTSIEAKQEAYQAGKAPNPAAILQKKVSTGSSPGTDHLEEATTEDNGKITTTSKALTTRLEFLPVPSDHDGTHPNEFFIRVISPPSDGTGLFVQATPLSESQPSLDFFLGTKFAGPNGPYSKFEDGSAVYAASLQSTVDRIRAFLLDANIKKYLPPTTEKLEWAGLNDMLMGWKWRLERAEGWEGVLDSTGRGGSYRIVNEAWKSSLSGSLVATHPAQPSASSGTPTPNAKYLSPVDVLGSYSQIGFDQIMTPHSLSQIWDLSPRVTNTPSGQPEMLFEITNHGFPDVKIQPQAGVKQTVTSKGWKFISLACVEMAKDQPRRYLIYDTHLGGFLGVPSSSNLNALTVCLGPWKSFSHEKLGDKADKFLGSEWFSGSELIKSMAFLRQDDFLSNYAYLVWRIHEDDLGPSDGIFTLSTVLAGQKTPTFLDIPLNQYLEPALLALVPPESRVTGSQWWRVTSTIDETTGEYTYIVINYRSGHYLELIDSATARTKDSPMPNLRGTRVVDPKRHSWRFVRIDGAGFQLRSQDNEMFCLHSNATTMLVEIADRSKVDVPTTWAMTKIPESHLSDGNYRLVNAQNGCDLWFDNGVCKTKELTGTNDQTWMVTALPSISGSPQFQTYSICASQPSVHGHVNKLAVLNGVQGLEKSDLPAILTDAPTIRSDKDIIEWELTRDASLGLWTIMPAYKSGYQKVLGIDKAHIRNPGQPQEEDLVSCRADAGSPANHWRIIKAEKQPLYPWNPQLSSRTADLASVSPAKVPNASGASNEKPSITKCRSFLYLPDGLYRLANRHCKLNLGLSTTASATGLPNEMMGKGLTSFPFENITLNSANGTSYGDIWYMKREPAGVTVPGVNLDDVYIIENYARPLRLDYGDPIIAQDSRGSVLWATHRVTDCASQRWRVYNVSNYGFKLQSMANGSFLDVGGSVQHPLPVVKPQITEQPTSTQLWRIEPVAATLDDGIYHISCFDVGNNRMLAIDKGEASAVVFNATNATCIASARLWRITADRGIYVIEDIRGANLLAVDAGKSLTLVPRTQRCRAETKWKLRLQKPEGRLISWTEVSRAASSGSQISFLDCILENISCALNLSFGFGAMLSLAPSSSVPSAGQRIHLSKVCNDIPFATIPTSNIIYGGYQIQSLASTCYLAAVSKSGILQANDGLVANAYPPLSPWMVVPSGVGTYALIAGSVNGLSLSLCSHTADGQDSIYLGLDGCNASRWRLLQTDVASVYRIVNCDTGLFVMDRGCGLAMGASDDGGTALQMWRLNLTTPVGKDKKPPALPREARISNGMYSILINPGPSIRTESLAIVCPNAAASTPKLRIRDLAAFSLNFAQEVWIVEQDRQGWSVIKHMTYGLALCLAPVPAVSLPVPAGSKVVTTPAVVSGDVGRDHAPLMLTLKLPDDGHMFQWKFLTVPGSTDVKILNRMQPGLVLAKSHSSSDVEMVIPTLDGASLQSWKMLRISGSPMDVSLQAGVYIMSTFEPITKSALIKNTDTTRQKLAKPWTGQLEPPLADTAAWIKSFHKPFMDIFTNAVFGFTEKFVAQAPSHSPSFKYWYNNIAVQTPVRDTLMEVNDLHGAAICSVATACFSKLVDRGMENIGVNVNRGLAFGAGNIQVAKVLTDYVSWRVRNPKATDQLLSKQCDALFSVLTTITTISKMQYQDTNLAISLIEDIGFAILSSLNAAWDNLAPQDSSVDATSMKNVLTAVGSVAYSTNSIPQYGHQMWAFEPVPGAPGTFTIGLLDKSGCLGLVDSVITMSKILSPNSAPLSHLWVPIRQAENSWLIYNVQNPDKVLSFGFGFGANVKCSKELKSSVPGACRQRWALRRSGYYIQSKKADLMPLILKVENALCITQLSMYAPFSQAYSNSSPHSNYPAARLDALYIFHLVKHDTERQYQLISEATGTALVVDHNTINVQRSPLFAYECLLKLMKDDAGLYIAIGMYRGDPGPSGGVYWKNFVGLQGDENWGWYQNDHVVQAKPLAKDPSCTWDLVSVGNVERGGPLSLPRVVLYSRKNFADRSKVLELDLPTGKLKFSTYKSDESLQRFRRIDFNEFSAFMHESTNRILCGSFDRKDADFLSLMGPDPKNGFTGCVSDSWFKIDKKNRLQQMFDDKDDRGTIMGHSFADIGIQVSGSNTGDLPASLSAFRIQIGHDTHAPPVVLTVSKYTKALAVADLDFTDDDQLWSYIEWEAGRYIEHVNSGFLLDSTPATASPAAQPVPVKLILSGKSTMYTLWQLETPQVRATSTLAGRIDDIAGRDGFHRLIIPESGSLSTPPRSLQLSNEADPRASTLVVASNGKCGVRFVAPAKSLRFTWRPAMLRNFLKTKLPVFVHSATSTRVSGRQPVAIAVDPGAYLPTLRGNSISALYATSRRADPRGVKTAFAKVFVQVRAADEAIYCGYTDFIVSILYAPALDTANAPAGWRSLTMRFNNDDNSLTAVDFGPNLGWVPNIDQSFTSLGNVDQNPLKIIKRPTAGGSASSEGVASVTKLHVYVDEGLAFRPDFPKEATNDVIAERVSSDFYFWDSGLDAELVEADFLHDDGMGGGPVRREFMDMPGMVGELWKWAWKD